MAKFAPTADAKRLFIFWKLRRIFKKTGMLDEPYGMDIITFDESYRIRRAVYFRMQTLDEKGNLLDLSHHPVQPFMS